MSVFLLLESPGSVAILSLILIFVSLTLLILRKKKHQDAKISAPSKISKNDENKIEEKPKSLPNKTIKILYGSQTGTAENYSKTLGEELKARYGNKVDVHVIDLDEYAQDDSEYEEKFSEESNLLFLTATYGDGEPTDNAIRFCKWLEMKSKEETEEKQFENIFYSVFGLGNRQYEHFNAIALLIDSQLEKLGCNRIIKVGLGDDDQCQEDDFNQWKEEYLSAMDLRFQGEGNGENFSISHSYSLSIPSYDVQFLHELSSTDFAFKSDSKSKSIKKKSNIDSELTDHVLENVSVKLCKELHTEKSERSCIHVELDLSSSSLNYSTGDHVAIYPKNEIEVVLTAAKCLGLPIDTCFSLHHPNQCDDSASLSSSSSSPLPDPFPPCSLKTALSCYADLLNSPKKSALLALADHTSDENEATRLRHLASPAGKDEYQEWIMDSHRSLLEVMEAFPSSKPPLGVFFASIAPRLQPRFYSISSSNKLHASSVHLTCAVVEEVTPGGRLHKGVCSNWLKKFMTPKVNGSQSRDGPMVPVFIRHSPFKLPPDPSSPIIMVGPGTGLAPFRGFLQERLSLLREGKLLGPSLLFFGCRNKEKDYIYEEELNEFVKEGALSSLHVAFSRQNSKKEYVQNHLMKHAGEVWKLISDGGYVYVCGDAKGMAKDVHRTLHTIIQKQEVMSSSEAEVVIKQLQTEGRYLRDVW